MSKSTRRKHVVREVLEDYVRPKENQEIVRVVAGRGNNLHEVLNASGDKYLASMPSKFRKNIWIKRGDFVLTEKIDEGDKVKAEIVHVLYKAQIRQLKVENLWPIEFDEEFINLSSSNGGAVQQCNHNQDDDTDDENSLFVNTNRSELTYEHSSSNSSDCEN